MPTLTTRRTYDVPDAAEKAGISTWLAFDEIRRTGMLAGVSVIRVGRRILIPQDAFDRVLAGDVTPAMTCVDGGRSDEAA